MRTIWIPATDSVTALLYTNSQTPLNSQAYVDMGSYNAAINMANKYKVALSNISNLKPLVASEQKIPSHTVAQVIANQALQGT